MDIDYDKDTVRLSRWVHVFESENVVALYHSLNIDVIYVPKEYMAMLDTLRKGTSNAFIHEHYSNSDMLEIVDVLRNKGFVVPILENDMELLFKKQSDVIPPIGVHSLYLLLTDNCNLRCSYCFVLNSMPTCYESSNMKWETAKEAVDMFFANLARNDSVHDGAIKVINFYGGEPLLRFPLIKQIVEYVEGSYLKELDVMGEGGFIYSLIVNGTLITPEIATYIASHPRIAVTISLDGDQKSHDIARRTTKNEGTYEAVINGIRILQEAGCIGLSISCTIDEHNIDSLDKLLLLNKEFDFLSINLNPLLDTEQQKVNGKCSEIVSDKMISYFLEAREEGIYEDRIMRRIKPFMSQRPLPYDCQATGSQIVCSPDGRLGVCHEGLGMKNYFFADVSKNFHFHEDSTIREWAHRSPLNMPQCFDCPAIGTCGGGCAYGAMLRNGTIWSLDDRFCIHSLKTLEWMIWDLYENSP